MQTTLNPSEYDRVQNVFKSLAQASWFQRTVGNERDCARLVLDMHDSGLTDQDDLYQACLPIARYRFSASPRD